MIQAYTYAKNEVEKAAYLDYYRTYYRAGGTIDGSSSSTNIVPDQLGKGANAVKDHDLGTVTVDGIEYKRYSKLLSKLVVFYKIHLIFL